VKSDWWTIYRQAEVEVWQHKWFTNWFKVFRAGMEVAVVKYRCDFPDDQTVIEHITIQFPAETGKQPVQLRRKNPEVIIAEPTELLRIVQQYL